MIDFKKEAREKSTQIGVQVTGAEYEILIKTAKENGLSVSRVALLIFREGLKKM